MGFTFFVICWVGDNAVCLHMKLQNAGH